MKAHSILGHLSILVAGSQMTQSTDGRLCDVLSVASSEHCSDQSLDAPDLMGQNQSGKLCSCIQKGESQCAEFLRGK